jgi:C_GCAxxG_C_C family probable redox protein
MVMKNDERAVRCFRNGYNCAQSVLSVFAPRLGLDRALGLSISRPFGGGTARMQETCGAVNGALMVMGLEWGKAAGDEARLKEDMYKVARQFVMRFVSLHGSVKCRDLLGWDISTDEGLLAAKERDLFGTRCEAFVRDAVNMLEEMLKSGEGPLGT